MLCKVITILFITHLYNIVSFYYYCYYYCEDERRVLSFPPDRKASPSHCNRYRTRSSYCRKHCTARLTHQAGIQKKKKGLSDPGQENILHFRKWMKPKMTSIQPMTCSIRKTCQAGIDSVIVKDNLKSVRISIYLLFGLMRKTCWLHINEH